MATRDSPGTNSFNNCNRFASAEVDEGHRADGGLEFLFFVADVPDADYLARCVLDRVITGHVRLAEDVDCAVESLTFVDIRYRFSLRIQDGPLGPAEYAARHIGRVGMWRGGGRPGMSVAAS